MDINRLTDEAKFLEGMRQGILWVVRLAQEEAKAAAEPKNEPAPAKEPQHADQ